MSDAKSSIKNAGSDLKNRPEEKRLSRLADAAAIEKGQISRARLAGQNSFLRADWFVPNLDSFGRPK